MVGGGGGGGGGGKGLWFIILPLGCIFKLDFVD